MREIPINRAVESSKLVKHRAELFPCGIVFLALSTIVKNCYFLTACKLQIQKNHADGVNYRAL
ncbi:hypothetical protein FEA40_00505 [Mannheimia haemolytica]|nr:hypothetical protein FEA40_00505 [Mannheimia haemolytica]TRC51444.1 hypothetical protein FEA32_00440 [Mannheimia haemolytica]